MATTYDKASLVMIPSGYKDDKLYSVKPTDGSGDFTFSRDGSGASPATRVNASGLIEKGRENILLQSNTFDTTWIDISTSKTSGQAGYDGSNDAWLLSKSASSARLYQNITYSGVNTFSIYAKAGTLNWMMLNNGTNSVWYDLQNGLVGSNTAGGGSVDASIESVGSGWYRVSLVSDVSASLIRIYPSQADNDISGTSGNIYIQDAQLEQGLVATAPAIETTTTAVSAGLLGDMPRLDYSGGATCPSLLLEPSRVNIQDQSEYIASWSDINSTQESNYATSPEGVQNATRMVMTSATGEHSTYNSVSVTSGTQYTQSIFLKQGDGSANWRYFQFRFRSGGFGGLYGVVVDLQEGTIGYDTGLDDYGIEDYGNGWYRVWITATATTTSSNAGPVVAFNELANAYDVSIVGDTNADVLIWGSQFEAGSYMTSYIPTYGSAASRAVDDLDTTYSTAFDTSSGGTILFHMKGIYNSGGDSQVPFRVRKDGGNYVGVGVSGANWRTRITTTSAGTIADISSVSQNDEAKIAIAWSSAGYAIYVNGSEEDSNTTSIADIDEITDFFSSLNDNRGAHGMKQYLLIPSKLTNAELAALTTI